MVNNIRIIMYAGKGGVGKTSVSCATGLKSARNGKKTIIISLDMAHSLSDSFALKKDLHDINKGQPQQIEKNLWIQEVDVQEELEQNWGEVHGYITKLLNSAGIEEVMAEELGIIPGMEEIVLLLYINKYIKKNEYDVLILDCAPTSESLRFISMPSALTWYMKKIFSLEKNLARVIRPLARVLTDVPIPDEKYFKAIQNIYDKLKNIDKVLLDKEITSVRLVTNPEKMVIKETQRSFMYFSMMGMTIDTVIVNRKIPEDIESEYFKNWIKTQTANTEKIKNSFAPVPVKCIPLFNTEITGIDLLDKLGEELFKNDDPLDFLYTQQPYTFITKDDEFRIEIKLTNIKKENIDLIKTDGELLVKVGTLKRYVLLPKVFSRKEPIGAKFSGDKLLITFE